jgi:ubiquinone/menaquinone biosynthesis C-methylase UbiE
MTGAAVLDVGCGAGEHSEEILGLWHAGRFAGIDVSVGIVKDAERKYRLSFLTGNAVSLPLADRSFDVVTSSYLFHHIPPSLRADALREQLRVGRYVLVRDLFAFERGVKRLLYRLYYTVFDGSEYRYTLAEWRALAAAAGAAIVDEGHVRPDLVRNRNCFFLLKSA